MCLAPQGGGEASGLPERWAWLPNGSLALLKRRLHVFLCCRATHAPPPQTPDSAVWAARRWFQLEHPAKDRPNVASVYLECIWAGQPEVVRRAAACQEFFSMADTREPKVFPVGVVSFPLTWHLHTHVCVVLMLVCMFVCAGKERKSSSLPCALLSSVFALSIVMRHGGHHAIYSPGSLIGERFSCIGVQSWFCIRRKLKLACWRSCSRRGQTEAYNSWRQDDWNRLAATSHKPACNW